MEKTEWTLSEFAKHAYEIAEEYGIHRYLVSVLACISGVHNGNDVYYTIQAWDKKSSNHIRASQPNPSSTLSEFSTKLNAHFKEYSKESVDMKLQ